MNLDKPIDFLVWFLLLLNSNFVPPHDPPPPDDDDGDLKEPFDDLQHSEEADTSQHDNHAIYRSN